MVKFPWHVQIPKTAVRWSVSQLCVVTPFLLTPSRIQSHETTLFRHKPFELSVSPTRSVQSTIMLIWLQSISEFIGQLDDNFAQSLIVKYSDKADSPLESVSGKLDNRKRGAHIWSWPKVDGKLNYWCLSSCAHSCGVAPSSKEVICVLRYTRNILGGEKSQGSGLLKGRSYV